MIVVRHAHEQDVDAIRNVFIATYGPDYAFPQFYDVDSLRRMIYGEDNLLLVAEDVEADQVVGTASVVMDVSAYADLVGEFGRLAVHPDARGCGVGKQLMQGRLERVRDRLHIGLVDNRVSHPFSQKISEDFGFVPVGFLPMKLLVRQREHISLFVRYFGPALQLRRNNPHVIPEVQPIANLAFNSLKLPCDCIIDDEAEAYPYDSDFTADELTSSGYASLLRIERGRVRGREVFGPMRLHYGLFKLKSRHSNYLLARRDGCVVGAIGFTIDPVERAVRIFELISSGNMAIRFLFSSLLERCRYDWSVEYLEIDVNATAPQLQRTLLELGFTPVAYVPGMVFHDVERVDAVKMVCLLTPFVLGELRTTERLKPFADQVLKDVQTNDVLPSIQQVIPKTPLFAGLNSEQVRRVAESCRRSSYKSGENVFRRGDISLQLEVVLSGQVELQADGGVVATLSPGQCLAERLLLEPTKEIRHENDVWALADVETLTCERAELNRLVRRRPDIGSILFRNVARDLARKLRAAEPHADGGDGRSAEESSKT